MNIAIDLGLLPRAVLRKRLLGAVARWRFEDTRLHALLSAGRTPRGLILRYALATYRSALIFTATIAEMVEKAPSDRAKLHLLMNLLEEEGAFVRASTGLVVRHERSHPALALRFLEACGGSAAMLTGAEQHATGPGRALLREGRWVEAVAHLLVGQELRFGEASGELAALFERAGVARRDLAFFHAHVGTDCRHGEEALDLVLDHADTRGLQEACVAEAEAGGRIWFDMHGGARSDVIAAA
ncbi:iron-containing redox enzyme family protein [Sandaracinobacteroides saxicola]|uniref:Iron-containing redox enzyme family protein n=1 Tax=Sandaracinobacteroides saxicola TaxID=2759707 RepID=A0A7G5IKQ6_9SPHN|nr:iron-containing redox enzyme family protein [Sandaracinobacteroides saxicola]QMW23948.1 iron-containing redox enzyme family protein [Sandaracinobacteroides saxicola]